MNNLSEEMKLRIQSMALRTWSVIGGDILTCTEEMGEEPILSRDEVVESVCDADYMMYHGGDKEAYNAWDGLPYESKIQTVKEAFQSERYGWQLMSRPCKGCKDAVACTISLKGSVAINECPCGTCLVKGVCESPCEAMNEHYESINMIYTKKMARKVKNAT